MNPRPNLWTRQRVAVSGGTGFTGRRIVDHLLNAGATVATVSRAEVSSVSGTHHLSWESEIGHLVEDIGVFAPTRILHIATAGGADHATTHIHPMLDANITLPAGLLEAAAIQARETAIPVPVVALGSFWQQSTPSERYAPNSFYAATKQSAFDLGVFYRTRKEVPFVQLRPWDIYGPDPTGKRFLQLVAKAVVWGKPLNATCGEQHTSFVHVDDVVDAILTTAATLSDTNELGTLYAVRTDNPRPLKQTIEELLAETGFSADIRWGARPYRKEEVMNPWPGTVLPGWSPTISLADGFRRLVDEAHG